MRNYTRRDFVKLAGLGAVASLAAARPGIASSLRVAPPTGTLYVGTYTSGRSEGIYRCRMDPASGAIRVLGATGGIANPSFLAVDRRRSHLYAVSQTSEFEGQASGSVCAFRIDPATGELAFINRQPSRGASPCHLSVDGSDRWVLVANYVGGNFALLPIQEGGGLGAPVAVVQHQGSGPNPRRQEAPHAHCVMVDSRNRFAFVVDLGIDKVMIYRLDARRGRLSPAPTPWAATAPGAGPRHFVFHPDGRRAYVINELDSTLTAFTYDARRGALRETQTVSTLPEGFTGENTCADVHVHPSGRFVYGSNRGHDSIAVFAIDPGTGALTPVQHQSTQGRTPRNFGIDPTGRFLLAANQNSDSVVTFAIDPATGSLSPTGHTVEIPSPVCVRFAAPHA